MSLGRLLLILSAVLSTLGPLAYATLPNTRRTWYNDEIGVHIMSYMAVFALVLDLTVVSMVIGTSRWFAWVQVGVFVFVPVVLAWRDWVIISPHFRKKMQDDQSTQ